MHQRKNYGEGNNSITSDDILGKDVIDPNGAFIGVVEKIHINPRNLEIMSISIDKGFLQKGLEIGKGYIKKITEHAVLLSVSPVYNLKGMLAFDSDGEKIGTISDIELHDEKNDVKNLIVSSGILKNKIKVPFSYVKTIGHNVFLNKSKKYVMALAE